MSLSLSLVFDWWTKLFFLIRSLFLTVTHTYFVRNIERRKKKSFDAGSINHLSRLPSPAVARSWMSNKDQTGQLGHDSEPGPQGATLAYWQNVLVCTVSTYAICPKVTSPQMQSSLWVSTSTNFRNIYITNMDILDSGHGPEKPN